MKKALTWLDQHALWLLLLAFTLLVLMHSFSTPVYEAPDEVWHDAFARWLALGNGLPSMLNNESGANQEVAQPPLYYAVASMLRMPLRDADPQALLWHNPGFGYQSAGTSGDNKNMLVHPPGMTRAELAVRITRLTSLAFGWLAVIAAYKLGEVVTGDRRSALITSALVAFHPQFVFLCGVVSNDSAAAALSATGLWLAARTLKHGLTWQRTAVMGFVCGLAALSKTSVLLLTPLLGALLIYWCWRVRLPWKIWLPALASFGLAVLFTGGWWYGRNWLLYGDPLGLGSHVGTLWGRETPATLVQLIPEVPLLLRSYWAAYGWGHITWPDIVPLVLTLANLAVLITGAQGWRVRIQRLIKRKTAPHRAALIRWMALAWFAGIALALVRWMTQVEAPHGRLLFPALSAWALLTATGLLRLERGRRTRWLAKAYLLLLVMVTALAPGVRLLATFAPPKLHALEDLPHGYTRLDWLVGDAMQLTGVSIPEDRFDAGDDVPVSVCWAATALVDRDYTVFVHVIGPENQRYGERHTWPGLGRYPTTLWQPGTQFCETYHLTMDGFDGPLQAQLVMGMFDAVSGERLPTTDINGAKMEPPVVGHVHLAGDGNQPIAGGAVGQVGSFASVAFTADNLNVASGDDLDLTFSWVALATTATDYQIFVHIWNPDMDAPLSQHDGSPKDGWYPTSLWRVGDIVNEGRTLNLPDDAVSGTYGLWVGMYDPATGERLPVDDDYGFNMVYLGEVTVE